MLQVCQPISLLAAAWGIPVVSWGCASPLLSDKTTYPTFSRVSGPWTALGPMFDSIADIFNWTRVGIITTNEDVMRMLAEATKVEMEGKGKQVQNTSKIFRQQNTPPKYVGCNFSCLTCVKTFN